MLHLILFGPPGAGKGTQAQSLVKKFSLLHLSTGELLRSEIAANTELGLEAKKYMDAGELVPDRTVIEMIWYKVNCNDGCLGVIYDGFPRTIPQAEALEKILNPRDETINALLSLEVPHDELVDRLSKRGAISGRSDDVTLATIENRIKVYHEKTKPLIDWYASQNKHYAVDGVGDIEEISERLVKLVKELKSDI